MKTTTEGLNGADGMVVSRSLLKDRAYDSLKSSILNEEFRPGTFLAERKLAEMLGMSKTPVKAALERLAMEGFVTISPQQCILVRDLQFDEIADQYEIRTALESFVVRELARRITEPQIRELRISLKRQHEISSTSEVDIWVEHDAAFHLLLAKQQGNQAIYRVMLDLKDRMHRIISRVFRLQPLRAEESLEEHTSIVESIIAGKGDEAANFVTVHLQRGRDLVLAPKK